MGYIVPSDIERRPLSIPAATSDWDFTRIGRPRLALDKSAVRDLLTSGNSLSSIAVKMGVDRNTLSRYVRSDALLNSIRPPRLRTAPQKQECRRCGIARPLSEFAFRRERNQHRGTCRDCTRTRWNETQKQRLRQKGVEFESVRNELYARSYKYDAMGNALSLDAPLGNSNFTLAQVVPNRSDNPCERLLDEEAIKLIADRLVVERGMSPSEAQELIDANL